MIINILKRRNIWLRLFCVTISLVIISVLFYYALNEITSKPPWKYIDISPEIMNKHLAQEPVKIEKSSLDIIRERHVTKSASREKSKHTTIQVFKLVTNKQTRAATRNGKTKRPKQNLQQQVKANEENYQNKGTVVGGRKYFTSRQNTLTTVSRDGGNELKMALGKYIRCLDHHTGKKAHTLINYTFPEMEQEFRRLCFKQLFGNEDGNICEWPTNELVGPLHVDTSPISKAELSQQIEFVQIGGWWKPKECTARHKVAIIIPFRDRESDLNVLMRQLHYILRRQLLAYRVIVVEQVDEYPFKQREANECRLH